MAGAAIGLVKAILLLCRREDRVSLKGLTPIGRTGIFRSGQWAISRADAAALVGGWMYLHPTKAAPSEFGGVVQDFEPVTDATLAHSDRIALIVAVRLEGREQQWRGRRHGMAHGGGLVEADLPHEGSCGGV